MLTTYKAIGFLGSLALVSVAFVKTAPAAPLSNSPCKGLEEAVCKAKEVIPGNKACNWISGYKTVAGTDRKSYCRTSTRKVTNSPATN